MRGSSGQEAHGFCRDEAGLTLRRSSRGGVREKFGEGACAAG